jgi:hypothetical protein
MNKVLVFSGFSTANGATDGLSGRTFALAGRIIGIIIRQCYS